jgi:hypothetical protein
MKRIELRGYFAKEPKIKARYCLNWAAANGTQRRGIASTAKFDDRHGDEKKDHTCCRRYDCGDKAPTSLF